MKSTTVIRKRRRERICYLNSLSLSVFVSILVMLSSMNQSIGEESFRPDPAQFAPLEKSRLLKGELVFVDHVNRRGSLRLHVDGHYHEGGLHHFAMLPYGLVRYHGAPAALEDIPLGTVLSGRFFLPPDPKTSAVPVIKAGSKDPTRPPENHALLLEDQMSQCLRKKQAWQLKEVQIRGQQGELVVLLKDEENEHTMTIDESTRIWRGRELLGIDDLIAEGTWPSTGKQSVSMGDLQLGLTWHPRYLYEQFHISDLWLDDAAVTVARKRQNGRHLRHLKMRWMPARVDTVEHGQFGQAVVTATLFGGMDESLYDDFKAGTGAQMAAAEHTLRTWWPDHDGMDGKLTAVDKIQDPVPLGSSGIQIKFDVELVLQGFRPGSIVKIRPHSWPKVKPPYEELVRSNQDRWPDWKVFE